MVDSCQLSWTMIQMWVGALLWGESHGSGPSQANWQDEGALMSSALPLLDAAWEQLSLKEKYQRLLIHLELRLRRTTWSGLSMQEKLAAVDPRNYDGYGIQIQAVCTARLRGNFDCTPYGPTKPGEVCGLGYPGQLWKSFPSYWSTERHPMKEYCCDFDWCRLIMEMKNPAVDLRLHGWIRNCGVQIWKPTRMAIMRM